MYVFLRDIRNRPTVTVTSQTHMHVFLRDMRNGYPENHKTSHCHNGIILVYFVVVIWMFPGLRRPGTLSGILLGSPGELWGALGNMYAFLRDIRNRPTVYGR